jgi:N-carbamoyl-L-amino-acid hydrolase
VEHAIREGLAAARPDDAILGEEFGSTGPQDGEHRPHRQWIIDPIDGTANFLRGVPIWGTLIALAIDGVPVVGVVSAPALGQRWFDVVIEGQDAHAGPTPLEMRRDALLAASRLVIAVREIAQAHPHYARGTVGRLIVSPNSRNVIPGRVELSIDLRNADAATLDAMADAVRVAASKIAADDGVSVSIEQTVHFPPCAFDPALVDSIESTAQAFGYTARRLASGAGHDAVYVARTCPAAMVFVPCEKGISHNEIENADPVHLHAGTNVMLHAVLARANR